MRLAVLTVATAAVLCLSGAQPGVAQSKGPKPWCIANGYLGPGTMDCAYWSLQQCLDSASGAGGVCRENPEILWARYYQRQRAQQGHRR